MTKSIISAFSLLFGFSVSASTIDFSYNATGAEPEGYGYKKEQVYSVGVGLGSPELIGKQVMGFTVPVFNTEYVSEVKAWLSMELTASKGNESTFTPDIASYEATVTDGVLTFNLPEAYTIPEQGVFIGYSFKVSGLPEGTTVQPVAVVDGTTTGGLWIHAGESQKRWADMAKRAKIVSAMIVTLEGDFQAAAASVAIDKEQLYVAENESGSVPVELTNWGTEGISSIEYTYTINGVETQGSYEFETSVPGVFGRKTTVDLDIVPQSERGIFTYDLTVTKVNGKENAASVKSASLPIAVQAFVPVYRPLAEEYTGLHCGWCPRGYVMIEQMKQEHGDKFVALSYHSTSYESGAMCCISPSEFPASISGYPAASFNRGTTVDPSDIPALWRMSQSIITPAEVAVDLKWDDATHKKLTATGKVRFANDIPESDYLLTFALVADGLSNPDWGQSNAYADYEATGQYTGPFWDLFVGKGSPVYGLEFNDIVVYYPDIKGIEGSLPESIEAEKWYEYTFEVETDSVKNLKGEHIVKDFGKTRVVAMVVNRIGGKPLNCISSLYPVDKDPTGIESVESSDATVVKTLYFDLQGRQVARPSNGIFIQRETLSDGTSRTAKVLR